jgi:hypothetical protein
LEYPPRVTSARACGVTENDFPNCQRAVNTNTAAGIAMANPIQRALDHSPRRRTTAESASATMQNWKTKNGVIFSLPNMDYSTNPCAHCG